MSFNFTAAGRKADVIRQLRHVNTYGDELGKDIGHLVAHRLRQVPDETPYENHEIVYVVKATGHGDASTGALHLEVNAEAAVVQVAAGG